MNICVTVNSKYMRYLYVMLLSLYEKNERGSIVLYVLQRDFTAYDKKIISEITNRFQNKVVYIFVDENKLNEMPGYFGGREDLPSEIICFRLLLPELLPESLDRVLLLDVDIVINKDISELYNIDFEKHILAAAPNMCHNFKVNENWKKWYPSNRTNWTHFNIGVLMWNLEEIRNSYPSRYILKQTNEHEIYIETYDEELFNVVFGENLIKEVSAEEWNYIITQIDTFQAPDFNIYRSNEEIKSHCAIIHYAAMNPWAEGANCEKFSLWWEYAERSPFYHDFVREQLLRNDQYIVKLEQSLRAERIVIGIFQSVYQLKGSGKVAEYLKKQKIGYYLYGAGMQAELFYDLLVNERVESVVKGVFDRIKTGEFYGIPIYNNVGDIISKIKENVVIIITPSSGREEIMKDLKEFVSEKLQTVLLCDFLDNIKTGISKLY